MSVGLMCVAADRSRLATQEPVSTRPVDLHSLGDLQARAGVLRERWDTLRLGPAAGQLARVGMTVRQRSASGSGSRSGGGGTPGPRGARAAAAGGGGEQLGEEQLWQLAEAARSSIAARTAHEERAERDRQVRAGAHSCFAHARHKGAQAGHS